MSERGGLILFVERRDVVGKTVAKQMISQNNFNSDVESSNSVSTKEIYSDRRKLLEG